MLEHGKEFFEWLESGAYLYVCGDARRMAKDVDATLHLIAKAHGRMDDAGAKDYIKKLRAEKRYLRDVYSNSKSTSFSRTGGVNIPDFPLPPSSGAFFLFKSCENIIVESRPHKFRRRLRERIAFDQSEHFGSAFKKGET